MSQDAEAVGVKVTYVSSEAKMVNITGQYRDGEYWRSADYAFRMNGSTAVLKTIDPEDVYSVPKAKAARDKVRETVADLPFVQAVQMFPEVDA